MKKDNKLATPVSMTKSSKIEVNVPGALSTKSLFEAIKQVQVHDLAYRVNVDEDDTDYVDTCEFKDMEFKWGEDEEESDHYSDDFPEHGYY